MRRNFCTARGTLFGCGAIFALPGTSSLVTAVRFLNGQGVRFIDYSGAKYTRFPPKIAAAQRALFRVVENGEFLNRLRNGHLEKSAATGIFRPSCSPTTAKTPRKVHLRLRFQNLGKPRTAGLCGGAAVACDCGPLSCYIFERGYHPIKHLQNRYQRSQER